MKSPIRLLGILICTVILSLILIGLAGCSPAKISAKALANYKASSQFPTDCDTQFPFQVTAGTTDTLTITEHIIDCDSATASYEAYWNSVNAQQYNGMRAYGDSLAAMQSAASVRAPPSVRAPTNRNRNLVRCPPSYTIHTRDTIESTAKLTALQRQLTEAQSFYQSQLTALQTKLENKTTTLKKRNKQTAFMGGLISIFTIYTFRHQLIGLFGNFFTLLGGLLRRKR